MPTWPLAKMDCSYGDICSYLGALDFKLDSEIGDVKMFKSPNDVYVTIGVDDGQMSGVLLSSVLNKIGKKEEDLRIFLDGKKRD